MTEDSPSDIVITPQPGRLNIALGEANAVRTQRGFIALLDALGFRALVSSDSDDTKVLAYLSTIRESLRNSGSEDIESIVFSDSIVLAKGGSDAEALLSLCRACSKMTYDLLMKHDPGIAVRGAVAYGKYTTSQVGHSAFIAGPPIVEAYDGEKNQNWAGIMLCRSALERARDVDLMTICNTNFSPGQAIDQGISPYLKWRGCVQHCQAIPFHDSTQDGFAILPGRGESPGEIRTSLADVIKRLRWLKLIAPAPEDQEKYQGTIHWLGGQVGHWGSFESAYFSEEVRRRGVPRPRP